MNLENKFLPRLIIPCTSKDVTLFACSYLRTHSIYHPLLRESFERKVVMATVTQSISVVYTQKSESNRKRDRHFAFRSRDINPAFASSLIERAAFPERNLAI